MTEVWIVEDDIVVQTAMKQAIDGTDGVRCSVVLPACEPLLQRLQENPERPDVLLLDIRLPGMSGIEGVAKIKALAPSTHVLMITVLDDQESVFQAICGGASGYVLKSASLETIVNSIKEVVDGGAPMTPSIARSVLLLFQRFAPAKNDYGLTTREKETLELMVEGCVKKQIAERLGLSYHTVDKHVRSIYEKLHVHSLSAAVAKAVRERMF